MSGDPSELCWCVCADELRDGDGVAHRPAVNWWGRRVRVYGVYVSRGKAKEALDGLQGTRVSQAGHPEERGLYPVFRLDTYLPIKFVEPAIQHSCRESQTEANFVARDMACWISISQKELERS